MQVFRRHLLFASDVYCARSIEIWLVGQWTLSYLRTYVENSGNRYTTGYDRLQVLISYMATLAK